jgi:hypothetical protein
MPYVAYAVVLTLLGGAGAVFWAGQKGWLPIRPDSGQSAPPVAAAARTGPADPEPAAPQRARPVQGLKMPPRPAPAEANPPAAPKPARASVATPAPVPVPVPIPAAAAPPSTTPSPVPSPEGVTGATDPAVPASAETPSPVKTRCAADGAWPAERTEQGKAIQGMLRDLGLYDGTVYGTVGPTTRAAIRRFQASAGEPETGEPDQALFDQLRKKCAAPPF